MNFDQFVSLSQVLTNFDEIKRLLGKYGEVVVVMDDQPQYRITMIDRTEDVVPDRLLKAPRKESSKGEATMEILNKIGKSTFIEHYYDFKLNRTPADELPEDFTTNSKRSRTSKARKIFRDELQIEALQIIMASTRLDQKTIDKAKEIYGKEISQI